MRRPIQILPENVVEKIAAGEVIERPASIVKELMENSLDALSTKIEIRLADGGRKEITVIDNGEGISSQEVLLALKSHATSKIVHSDDLFQVSTYGFRGEALSSIAAVSQLQLLTRTKDQTEGVRIRMEGGVLQLQEPSGTPIGTQITVWKLFFNTPARKKFLKSKSTELGHIESVVRKASLFHIEKSFILENDGEVVLQLPSAKNLEERVGQLFGKETLDQIVPLFAKEHGIELKGVVSNSHLSYSRPDELYFFVNGRPVKDRILQAAVLEGYRTALMERAYPLAVLSLEIKPELVDVNVHPTKAEVRFADSQPIFKIVSQTIASELRKAVSPLLTSRSIQNSQTIYSTQLPFSVSPATARTDPSPYLPLTEKGPFGSLQFLEVLDGTFLICRDDKNIILIDQHAAHERVRFEELKNNYLAKKPTIQPLLVPLTMEVNAQQNFALQELGALLVDIGFAIEAFGEKTWVIKSIPQVLKELDPRPLLSDLAAAHIAGETQGHFQDKIDHVLSTVACHSAVRAHDRLSFPEIEHLFSRMDEVDLSSNCPHGRPTFIKLTVSDLERMFRRK